MTCCLYLSVLLTVIPCSSKASLPWGAVVCELLQCESFPQAAVLHELFPYWSLLQGAVLREQTALQVHSGPWGHKSCQRVYFSVGFPWGHNLLESHPPSVIRGSSQAAGVSLLHHGPPWAAEAQLPHPGLYHRLQLFPGPLKKEFEGSKFLTLAQKHQGFFIALQQRNYQVIVFSCQVGLQCHRQTHIKGCSVGLYY